MITKTTNNLLLPYQRKQDIYLPLDFNGNLILKQHKFIKWSLRIASPLVGGAELYQLIDGYLNFGWKGIEYPDLFGFTIAVLPVILLPTFLFKPKKAWPFRFISFEEDALIFNFKRKTIKVKYNEILRFQIDSNGSRCHIRFTLKDNSSISAPWIPENTDKKHIALRIAINDELNSRINN